MLTFLASALGIAKRIPSQVWIIAAALAALWLYGHHREAQGRAEGRAEIIAKVERERRKQQDELTAASIRYENLRERLREAERTDRETIREIYREKPVPAECAADPRAVSLLSEAVTRANAAASGQSGSTVPETP